jgi:hypothetical protein
MTVVIVHVRDVTDEGILGVDALKPRTSSWKTTWTDVVMRRETWL